MSKHRYHNIDQEIGLKEWREVRRWQRERKGKVKDLTYQVPAVDHPDLEFLQSNRSVTSITWIGHSTFLVQSGGLNILTDPVWAKRMGIAKRLTPPGIPLSSLPNIDVVLISHSHYDHLHYSSLRQLPGDPLYLVPAGLARSFRWKGLSRVQQLNWWESCSRNDVSFTFVPAQHWTRRTLWDTNRSHWGGWVVSSRSDEGRAELPVIYFAGDSGYFSGFREIGHRFRIDYALMPIGAYEPEWFMKAHHTTPEEAIQAYEDVGATWFVPMHYGAFRLADDTPREALDRLTAEWEQRGHESDRLRILKHGETIRHAVEGQ